MEARMAFIVPIESACKDYPQFTFVEALPPNAQKAAFHVRNAEGIDLCLKIIAPDYELDRVSREIHALQTINHSNVVSLVEYTYSQRPERLRHYIVEQFVPGSDLADHLTGEPWTPRQVLKFFTPLADGLDALRKADVVHRDLKPSNIRVKPDGTPVIIDFGLARHLALPDLTYTADGAAIGTPLYFAPEQFIGTKRDIDHRTDLFALGELIHNALTGTHPFYKQGMNHTDLQAAVCNLEGFEITPSFEHLSEHWKLVLRKLLAVERGERFNSARQLVTVLQKIGS